LIRLTLLLAFAASPGLAEPTAATQAEAALAIQALSLPSGPGTGPAALNPFYTAQSVAIAGCTYRHRTTRWVEEGPYPGQLTSADLGQISRIEAIGPGLGVRLWGASATTFNSQILTPQNHPNSRDYYKQPISGMSRSARRMDIDLLWSANDRGPDPDWSADLARMLSAYRDRWCKPGS
jgi:hypothetical protein